MAQIPNLTPANTLGVNDETIIRQNGIDKRIGLQSAIADITSNTNLLSNHNFLIPSPENITHPSETPTTYAAGDQIFAGVFAGSSGILNLTYIDGRVSFSGGDFYMAVPNTGAIARLTSDQLTASVADFDGKPRTRGVSFALVGGEYRVTVGVDAIEDDGGNATPLGSVKFEQGKVATGHEVGTNPSEEGTNRQKETTGLSGITDALVGIDLFPLIGQGIRVDGLGLWIVPDSNSDGTPLLNPSTLDAIPTSENITVNGGTSVTLRGELSEAKVTAPMIGKSRTMSQRFSELCNVEDYPSIQAAADASAGRTLYYPDGTFDHTEEIALPVTSNVLMEPAAFITTTGTFDNIFVTDDGVCDRRVYRFTNIDCNNTVKRPFFLRNGRDCEIQGTNIVAPLKDGLRLGDPTLDGLGKSYGHHIMNYRANRQLGASSNNPLGNAGTVGLNEQSVTDVKGSNIEMAGFETGHFGQAAGFYNIFHVWASQANNLMDVGFIPGGDSTYILGHADQPQSFGWRIDATKFRVGLYGCLHYNSPNGGTPAVDPVTVHIDPAVGAFTCYGLKCRGGADGILRDFDITTAQRNSSQFDIRGTTYENVSQRISEIQRNYRSEIFEVYDDVGGRKLQIAYDSGSGEVRVFSDDASSNALVFKADGTSLGKTPSDKIGFFGATPVTRRTASVDVTSIHTALVDLGLITT